MEQSRSIINDQNRSKLEVVNVRSSIKVLFDILTFYELCDLIECNNYIDILKLFCCLFKLFI